MRTLIELMTQINLFTFLLFAMWNLFPCMPALGNRILNQVEPSYRRLLLDERWRLSCVYQHAFW